MRKPSDRTALWANYRRRLVGAGRAITTTPEPGFYKVFRGGRWLGVQIDLVQDIDEDTSELFAEEKLVAWIDGRPADPDDVWTYCASNPITPDEFERLKGRPAVRDLSRSVVV